MADEHAEQLAEHDNAGVTHTVGRQLGAQPARTGNEVGLSGEDRRDHAPNLLRLVLAIGVDRADLLCAARARERVPELERRTLAAVEWDVTHERPRALSLGRRL